MERKRINAVLTVAALVLTLFIPTALPLASTAALRLDRQPLESLTALNSAEAAERGVSLSAFNVPSAASVVQSPDTITEYLRSAPSLNRLYDGMNFTINWTYKSPMPKARYAMGIAIVDGKIYSIGGFGGGTDYQNDTFVYDPTTDTWMVKSPMPTTREYLGAAVVDGKIYAIGGDIYLTTPYATNEMYDPMTNTWVTKTPMPTPRWNMGVVAVNDKIYVIGGETYSGGVKINVNVNEVYDSATDSWATLAPRPIEGQCVAVALNGQIYTFGGGPQGAANYQYDPTTDMWTAKAPMPGDYCGNNAVVMNWKIYAGFMNGTYRYDSATDTWEVGTPTQVGRIEMGVASVNDRIFTTGGQTWPGPNYVDTLEVGGGPPLPPDITGIWQTQAHVASGPNAGETFAGTVTLEQSGTQLSGTFVSGPYSGEASGTYVDGIVNLTYWTNTGYTSEITATVSLDGNTLSGNWTDNFGRAGTYTATRSITPPTPRDPLILSASSTYATNEHVIARTNVYNSSSASKTFNVAVSLLKDGGTEAIQIQMPTVAGYGTASLTFDFGTRAAGSYQIKAELLDGPTLLKTKWASFTVLDSTGIRLAGEHAEELKGTAESEFNQMATIPARAFAKDVISLLLDTIEKAILNHLLDIIAPFKSPSPDSIISQTQNRLADIKVTKAQMARRVRVQVKSKYGVDVPFSFDPLNPVLTEFISDPLLLNKVKSEVESVVGDVVKEQVIKPIYTDPEMGKVGTRDSQFKGYLSTRTFAWQPDIEQTFDRGRDAIANTVESDVVFTVGPYDVLGQMLKYEATLIDEQKVHDFLAEKLKLISVILVLVGIALLLSGVGTSIAAVIWKVALLLGSPWMKALAIGVAAFMLIFSVPKIAPNVTTKHDDTLDAIESIIGSQGQALRLTDFTVATVRKGQPVKLSARVESSEIRRTANPVVETTIYNIDGRVVKIIWANPTVQPYQTALLEKEIALPVGKYKAVTTIHTGDQIAIASQAQTFQVAEPELQLGVSLNKTQFTLGEAVRASITVTNTDVISDANDLTLIAESSDGQNFDAWPVSLATGESKEIEYSFIPPQEGSYVLHASLSMGLNVLASKDVGYLVGSGPALALNFSAQEVYDPGLDVTVPLTLTNVGDQASAITLTVTTLDLLHDLTQVFSQTHDLNVDAGPSTALNATVLPGAQPGLYTTRLALGGEMYSSFDFAVAAQDTLFADIYPDAVIHQVGDIVQLNVQVMNSVYTYTAATTDVVLTEPTGVTQTIAMSGADGQYQGSYTANITGTYPIQVSVSKPDYRAVANASFFIAGERSVLLPTVTGQPAVGQTAPLTVTVENELGTTIPEATVELTRTNESYSLSTDESGQAVLLLTPDSDESYHLTVSKMGFMETAMEVLVAVISDTVPPFIIFDALAEGQFVNTTPLTITGMTEVSSTLSLNAQPVAVDVQGLFTVTVALNEGDNLLTAVATDSADNSTTVTRTVNLDTVPPALTVTTPRDGLFTNSDVVTVTGSTEVTASLTVSGTLSTVQPDGSFTAWTLLERGESVIPVVSTDVASNSTTITRTVGYSPLFADFDYNCMINVSDIMKVAANWRCRLGDGCYNENYDLDKDGDIDIVDIMLVAIHWGETCE